MTDALTNHHVVSFVCAVLIVYTINLQVHGVFGVPLADWRGATPPASASDYAANLQFFWQSLTKFLAGSSHNIPLMIGVHLIVVIAATVTLARTAPLEVLYLYAGAVTGLGLILAQNLKLGVFVPPRAFLFIWPLYAVLIVRAVQHLAEHHPARGRQARHRLILLIACHVIFKVHQYVSYRAWQHDTAMIADAVSDPQGPVLVYGRVLDMPSAQKAAIQTGQALPLRLQQLADRDTVLCATTPETCAAILADQAPVAATVDVGPDGWRLR